MSLWDLIEAKEERRRKLPVLVGDVEAATAAVATLRGALDLRLRKAKDFREARGQPTEADDARIEKLRAELADALARQAACVVEVELRSLPPDEWDAILDHIEDGPDGPDLSQVRADLVAASCVDEEMRDRDRWAAQFAKPVWSKGDLLAVNNVLLQLNLYTPGGSGKD